MKDWVQRVIFSGNSLSDNKLYLLKDAETGECNVTTNIKAAMVKTCMQVMRATPYTQNTYLWQPLLPLHCHDPLYQITVNVLWYMQEVIS